MVQITFEVSDVVFSRLENQLGEGASAKIAETAFTEWADWFFAKRRPINQIEVEVSRVVFLYTEILVKSAPSANHLSSLLQITPGHSVYLMRSLRSQYNNMISKRLLEDTLQRIENAVWNNRDSFLVDVPPECKPVLDRVLANLFDTGKINVPIRGSRRGDFFRYSLGRNHYDILRAALQEEINLYLD